MIFLSEKCSKKEKRKSMCFSVMEDRSLHAGDSAFYLFSTTNAPFLKK